MTDARKWLGRARSINREIEGLLEEQAEARAQVLRIPRTTTATEHRAPRTRTESMSGSSTTKSGSTRKSMSWCA